MSAGLLQAVLLTDKRLRGSRSCAPGRMPWHTSFPNHSCLPTRHQLVTVRACSSVTRTDWLAALSCVPLPTELLHVPASVLSDLATCLSPLGCERDRRVPFPIKSLTSHHGTYHIVFYSLPLDWRCPRWGLLLRCQKKAR